jgi:DNA repair exonuclease SbcCD nuclease subunit
MSTIKLLHAADLHLDSPFEALPAGKASIRRKEQRELLDALAQLAAKEQVDLVLLSGDLLDSSSPYFETGEELVRRLRSIPAPVVIAPGNHDCYTARSPYARLQMPENVYIFRENAIRCLELPKLHARVYGAAFTEERSGPLLRGFCAERTEGVVNLLCLHGDLGVKDSPYDPITEEELAQSGLDYAALGHVHKASGLRKAGNTWYSWPGCPEGRGFDETGEKTVNLVELENGQCRLRQVSIAGRRYETLRVDVTGTDPLLAIHSALPDDTVCDVYRLILTGETDTAPDLKRLYANLSELFFELQLRDETRLRQGIWDCVGEDTLRGLFLGRLKARYDAAGDELERRKLEQAARWGLAALDNAEEVVQHEDQ